MDEKILLQLRFDKLKEEYVRIEKREKRTYNSIGIMLFIIIFMEVIILNDIIERKQLISFSENVIFGLIIAILIQYVSTLENLDRNKSDLRITIFELFREMNSKGIVKLVDENEKFIKDKKII